MLPPGGGKSFEACDCNLKVFLTLSDKNSKNISLNNSLLRSLIYKIAKSQLSYYSKNEIGILKPNVCAHLFSEGL